MTRVMNGRYTARADEPFVVFIIGVRHPRHERRAGAVPGGGGLMLRAVLREGEQAALEVVAG